MSFDAYWVWTAFEKPDTFGHDHLTGNFDADRKEDVFRKVSAKYTTVVAQFDAIVRTKLRLLEV